MLRLNKVVFWRNRECFKFNFSIKKATSLAIMGSSGAGKSTLLDLIAGFEKPQSGCMVFDGIDLLPLPVSRRPVTLLFQSDNLFPHLSLFDNIALGLSLKRKLTAQQRDKIEQVIEKVGLKGLEKRHPNQISGGQSQRAALARSLLRAKPLLLLDEPFSALDTGLRMEMIDLVSDIVEEYALTLILVTHNKEDAKRLADKIFVINKRELVV